MKDYQLVIRVPVKALDDPEARAAVLDIISQAEPIKRPEISFKLQRLEEKQAPVGVAL